MKVINDGPTTIPNARLRIFWPYRPSTDSNLTLLYPAMISVRHHLLLLVNLIFTCKHAELTTSEL